MAANLPAHFSDLTMRMFVIYFLYICWMAVSSGSDNSPAFLKKINNKKKSNYLVHPILFHFTLPLSTCTYFEAKRPFQFCKLKSLLANESLSNPQLVESQFSVHSLNPPKLKTSSSGYIVYW